MTQDNIAIDEILTANHDEVAAQDWLADLTASGRSSRRRTGRRVAHRGARTARRVSATASAPTAMPARFEGRGRAGRAPRSVLETLSPQPRRKRVERRRDQPVRAVAEETVVRASAAAPRARNPSASSAPSGASRSWSTGWRSSRCRRFQRQPRGRDRNASSRNCSSSRPGRQAVGRRAARCR
jgi:hypothetical protein